MSYVEPPAGLDASGKSLWDAVVTPYALTPAELSILTQACYTADELDRLEAAVRELPELTAKGSTGQLKPHPLLAEVRAHRALLQRLMEGLNLPDQDQQVGLRGGARHAAKAARARWGNREAAG
jgi:hypothetical protein